MQTFCSGYDLSENGQAMDALREVGPGSHFLGCAHTRANFESAFWRSGTADNNSFEQLESEGGRGAYQRDTGLGKKRSEERGVGKEGGSPGSTRWWPVNKKK